MSSEPCPNRITLTEWFGDMWDYDDDAVKCITTNGTVRADGRNVMGGGCAREAAERNPWLPLFYGDLIALHGHHVFLIGDLIMFPVKNEVEDLADLDLIKQSCRELMILADLYKWAKIALPTPGCGLGGLQWEDVSQEIAPLLDPNRVVIVRYAREEN